MEFVADELDQRQRYKLLTGSVIPRPIALVTTLGPQGPNAAPFSFFNVVAVDPATIMFSVGTRPDGSEKDTLRNIRHLPEFVVHLCNSDIAHQVNICSKELSWGVSEIEAAGFTTGPSKFVKPPRILEAPVQLECRLHDLKELGREHRHNVIFGEIVLMNFRDDLVDQAFNVDQLLMDPIGRLAGGWFGRVADRFRLEENFVGHPGSKETKRA